jgi:L-arabinokinase
MSTSPLFLPPLTAETRWSQFETQVQTTYAAFFDGTGPIVGARAPGRLDVIGGVADYSGSFVLEMPLAEAAYVAWQWREDRLLRIWSKEAERDGMEPLVEVSLDVMVNQEGDIRPADEVRHSLTQNPKTRWASYVAGCFYVMLQAYGKFSQGKADTRLGQVGANILIESDVPLGAGVSSSAALEVATMHALSEAAGIQPSDLTLAAWCQRAENMIVGAPCGIMDQVTSALGAEGTLLALRCQPHDLLGNYVIPRGWRFLGIDSRVKHSVGGSAYTKARVGAFMGLKILQLETGKLLDNYLCNMKPEDFIAHREMIPETLTGQEYSDLFGYLPDIVTRVVPDETYRPRSCAEHPILESSRVLQFIALMRIAEIRQSESETNNLELGLMESIGQLMYEAHASYSDRIALGSEETDLLVELIRERGVERHLYGAKITGGGAGGTVAVLCQSTPEAEAALQEVCTEYTRRTGLEPRLFLGSSPGALSFGTRYIERG